MSSAVEKRVLPLLSRRKTPAHRRNIVFQINVKEIFIMKYVCNLCGWVYDEEETGVKWEDLPEDFACELCGVGKDQFSPEE